MLDLPEVTLICLTNRDFPGHQYAIQKSTERIHFGGVKLIWDDSIRNIDDWNYRIIFELHHYVQTPFALLVHADGYVIHPERWNPQFLDYDYIGAPWPLPTDEYSYRTPQGELVRVGNSVSLRSKRIMELPSRLGLEWKHYYGNTNEDGFLCVHNRDILKEMGCTFAPLEVAKYFSKEYDIEENKGIEETFCFHTVDV